jgi:UDP-N-acetylglucosamine 4-epimerase
VTVTADLSAFEALARTLRAHPRRWLVTGAAGFIGSHLAERLLALDQEVVGLDNYETGSRENVEAVRALVAPEQARRFRVIEGDIRDPAACREACRGVDVVLHEAALGSVPRSVEQPLDSHDVNVTGFLRVLEGAREAGVKRVVYASSSSVYGDDPTLPKVEQVVGRVLSPYAATKYANELYAHAYGSCYGLELIGLRYFNVFGPRQDPNGPYAAVIPIWFAALLEGREVTINGDGSTSRDFCYVDNVVQANLLAATTLNAGAVGQLFNVAYGGRTTLLELFAMIRERVAVHAPAAATRAPVHRPFRPGDIKHSLADVAKARALLGYAPTHDVAAGLDRAASWYVTQARAAHAAAASRAG